jgi:hypothetical protein
MEREKFELRRLVENFQSPAMRLGGGFDIAQDGADVNRLAMVTIVIFAEPFHVENFTQRREDARKNVPLSINSNRGWTSFDYFSSVALNDIFDITISNS